MNRNLKKWEIALMLGVILAFFMGVWLDREQKALADSVIRLHVVANSDSEWDQQLKLEVRDEVLRYAERLYPEHADLETARQVLKESLGTIEAAGEAVLEKHGETYPVRAGLERCWFPTKEYQGFQLPAGNYNALRVELGEGRGKNWWCVAFPPLCLGAASETLDHAVEAGHFTPAQLSLITEENRGYVLKFKGMELLDSLKQLIVSRGR